MMKPHYLATALLALLGASLPGSAQEKKPTYGAVTYRINEKLTAEQGTLELWVRPDVDVTQATDRFHQFFVLRISRGEKQWGDQGAVSLYWDQRAGLMSMANLGSGKQVTRVETMPADRKRRLRWDKGTWHHVALTWKDKQVRLFADGELVEEQTVSAPLPIGAPGWIILGYSESAVAVDEFMASSIAREPEAIKQRMAEQPKEDQHTLIYDPMETVGPGRGRYLPVSAESAELVEGKFGSAIQLYVP